MSDWVRITVIGPDLQPVDNWSMEDGWYRLGGHRHPDEHQLARDELAAEELREWLRRCRPERAGHYTLWVAELDQAAGTAGGTWASVRVAYAGRRDVTVCC